MSNRPPWDDYFFEVVDAVAKRATCDRGRAGCVIVRDRQILVTGYVGSPPGLPHCDEIGHLMKTVIHSDGKQTSQHCMRTIHAERNAICQAAKRGVALDGATLYVGFTPCEVCAAMIISCGIKRVVCRKKYQLADDSILLFQQAGVEIEHRSDDEVEYEK